MFVLRHGSMQIIKQAADHDGMHAMGFGPTVIRGAFGFVGAVAVVSELSAELRSESKNRKTTGSAPFLLIYWLNSIFAMVWSCMFEVPS